MSGIEITTPAHTPALPGRWARFRAHVTAALVDHGLFRMIYQNRFEVVPGVYRSSQPTPRHLAAMKRLGVRTVVNLRGPGMASYHLLERDACAELGLTLVNFIARSRDLPSRGELDDAMELFRTIEYPALFHCKSGADRAGFMSALYLLAHEGRPVEEAMGQLSMRFGHIRNSKTGILDRFFATYRDYRDRTGGSFIQWLDEEYDREKIKLAFHEGRWATLLVDRVLRRE